MLRKFVFSCCFIFVQHVQFSRWWIRENVGIKCHREPWRIFSHTDYYFYSVNSIFKQRGEPACRIAPKTNYLCVIEVNWLVYYVNCLFLLGLIESMVSFWCVDPVMENRFEMEFKNFAFKLLRIHKTLQIRNKHFWLR